MITRRGLLQGIFAAGIAPAIVRAEILMPVRKMTRPPSTSSNSSDPSSTAAGI